MHFLHFNINSLLPKTDEINFIAKQSNASTIGINESKLNTSVTNIEVNFVGYDVIRMDRSRRGGGFACYIIKSLSYNHKSSFCPNIEIISTDIFLTKSKLILVSMLYRPPGKSGFTEYLDNSLKESNNSYIQECYLMGDFNINLLSRNKMLLCLWLLQPGSKLRLKSMWISAFLTSSSNWSRS